VVFKKVFNQSVLILFLLTKKDFWQEINSFFSLRIRTWKVKILFKNHKVREDLRESSRRFLISLMNSFSNSKLLIRNNLREDLISLSNLPLKWPSNKNHDRYF
jgi:hypothetical protein